MRNKIILPLLTLPLLCGCTGMQRPVSDAAFGAGGGLIGDKLSNGNPAAIAGGAAGGVAVSEGFQYWKSHSQQKAYTDGYNTGRSDGVKQLYWNLQQQQRVQPQSKAPTVGNPDRRE